MSDSDIQTISNERKYIASVSWGKDSLCMLLLLIEKEYPLDEVVFFDTGMEFQAIYNTRDKVLPLLKEHGITYTELYPKEHFLWNMLERPVKERSGLVHKGYSWCGGPCRWGTTEKLRALDAHCKGAVVYVGLAHDERERLRKNRADNKVFPLAEWKIPEGHALIHCYQHGYWYKENEVYLYSLLDRVSCWCCSNKNLKELRNYYNYLPYYWKKLKELQLKTHRPFKRATVFEIEDRFRQEASE